MYPAKNFHYCDQLVLRPQANPLVYAPSVASCLLSLPHGCCLQVPKHVLLNSTVLLAILPCTVMRPTYKNNRSLRLHSSLLVMLYVIAIIHIFERLNT